jgi:hypothetical protein
VFDAVNGLERRDALYDAAPAYLPAAAAAGASSLPDTVVSPAAVTTAAASSAERTPQITRKFVPFRTCPYPPRVHTRAEVSRSTCSARY